MNIFGPSYNSDRNTVIGESHGKHSTDTWNREMKRCMGYIVTQQKATHHLANLIAEKKPGERTLENSPRQKSYEARRATAVRLGAEKHK